MSRNVSWRHVASLVAAALASLCGSADAVPEITPGGVCPLRAGAGPNQIDVFDGKPSEQVILAPDDDAHGADTYTVKDVYARGRTVTIRCHFGTEAIDVEVTKPVTVCRYSRHAERGQIACR